MGLMRMAARTAVVAGTATAVAGSVNHRQQEKYAAQDAQAAAAAAPAAPAAEDPTEKVKQLADLHAQGILSDEEFAAAKKKALGI
jgi:membrane protease subunit (stomatin/prohibitin family)